MATQQEDINDASMRTYLEEERARIPQDILDDANRLHPEDKYSDNRQLNNPLIITPLRNAYIQGRLDERANWRSYGRSG